MHFKSDYVLKETSCFDSKSGRQLTAPLAHPRLRDDAVPEIFPNCPAYLSVPSYSRESPETKRMRLENKKLQDAISEGVAIEEKEHKESSFQSLLELTLLLKNQTPSPFWTVIEKENQKIFASINVECGPVITTSIIIDNELLVSAYHNTTELKVCGQYKLPMVIKNSKDLFSVLNVLESFETTKPENGTKPILDCVSNLLERSKHMFTDSHASVIEFIIEQLLLLTSDKRHYNYSSGFLIFSSLVYSISPHSYKFFRNSENIILPHPSTIRKICSSIKSSPLEEQEDSNFLKYSREKFHLLTEKDRLLVLMVDEIHLKPYFDYKGGNVVGMASNSAEPASSAHVFMVASLLSPHKDVVHILPAKTITAETLHDTIKKIVIGLEEIGFSVICVVSDNNAINRKAMSYFCPDRKVSIVYPHPSDSSKPLFYVIDSVHILKCIRNNWLNQKNPGQCMFFPSFGIILNPAIETASFETLKKLHGLELQSLAKFGYGLTLKALHPTNLEKQNVKLALQVFSENIVAALSELGERHNLPAYKGTRAYIETVLHWWKIMNVKHPHKGKRLRDAFMQPLTLSSDNESVTFLENVLVWMDMWKESNFEMGTLTKETHLALTHTTHAILELAKYCITELHFNYFLPGKIQTDPLEERFGKYRMLAGSQYNVSIRQVFESEAKLRLQNSLPLVLNSNKFGLIEIKSFDISDVREEKSANKIGEMFRDITVEEKDLNEVESVIPVLTYLAGYCVYGLLKKLKCQACHSGLVTDKYFQSSHSLIKEMDRGGLQYPHPDVVSIVMNTYVVLLKLISKTYEQEFLNTGNHKQVLVTIVTGQLKEELSHLDVCEAGHTQENLIKSIIRMSSNTFLKNYCVKKNDTFKKIPKNRKLTTLTNSVNVTKSLP